MYNLSIMTSGERNFGEAKQPEVIPAVQEILRIQSNPVMFDILSVIRHAESGVTTSQLMTEMDGIPTSTLFHQCTRLEEEGLITKGTAEKRSLTQLGESATDALQDYQERLLKPMRDAGIQRFAQQFSVVHAEELSRELSEAKGTAEHSGAPALLRLMRIEADPSRLRLLHILAGSQEEPVAFRDILGLMQSAQGRIFPGSTLSNLLTELERECLLIRESGFCFRLTTLGSEAVLAYQEYQDRIKGSLVDYWRNRFSKDFGIKPS